MSNSTHYMVAMVRNGHVYAVVYTPDRATQAIRAIGRWAGDPRLRFDWTDAAVLCLQIQAFESRA